jgi:HAD superfamily hydrolase (TIGR01509 family)
MTNASISISAVVFDLDGLLIDSEPLQRWAWGEYVARHGKELSPAVFHQMLGMRNIDAVEIAIRLLELPVTGADALRDRDEIFLAAVPGAILPMPGALDLLDALRARGVPLALATSGHRRYVDLALASAGLSGCFDAEVTADLVTRGKPDPDVYLQAARLLHVDPATCLALEDAPNGILSAKAAGMRCFAIPGETDIPLDYSAADGVLSSLSDVLPEIERRGWRLAKGNM